MFAQRAKETRNRQNNISHFAALTIFLSLYGWG